MIDLIAKNLTAEQQIMVDEFRRFTMGMLTGEVAHQKANALREAVGKQLCTFANLDWAMLVKMAFHSANNNYRSLGLDKVKFPELTMPKGHPARELAVCMGAFIKSCKKGANDWLVNLGLEINKDVAQGFVSSVVTMTYPKNAKHFDELFEGAKQVVVPMVTATFAHSIGVPEAKFDKPKVEKEHIHSAAARLLQFCMDNPDGFAIC